MDNFFRCLVSAVVLIALSGPVFSKQAAHPKKIRTAAFFQGAINGPGPAGNPVVNSVAFVISSPVTNGGAVGTATCSVNCSALTWSITGGNSAGNFAINSSTGAITTTSSGVTNIVDQHDAFSLTVQASNGTLGSNTASVDAYADGSVNAPGGCSPLYPTFFAGKAVRSPWKVANVDYGIGCGGTTATTDPLNAGVTDVVTALHNIGCGWDGNALITCQNGGGFTCDNSTISGYNFGLHNGLQLFIENCANPNIVGNNFKVGTNINPFVVIDPSVNGCTISNNSFDGNFLPITFGGGLIRVSNYNNCNVFYNSFVNTYYQPVEAGGTTQGTAATTLTFNYNSVMDAGTGGTGAIFTASFSGNSMIVTSITSGTIVLNAGVCPISCQSNGNSFGYVTVPAAGGGVGTYTLNQNNGTAGSQTVGSGDAHGDWVQNLIAAGEVYTAIINDFNTLGQSLPAATAQTQGLSMLSAGGIAGGSALYYEANYNSISAPATTNVNDIIIMDNTWLNGTANVIGNYIDPSSTALAPNGWLFFGSFNGGSVGQGHGPFNGTMTLCKGNINMVTGVAFTVNGGTSAGCTSFLLKRDIDPAANDNDPMWLEKAA